MITTCLWFQNNVELALARYESLFDDFEVHSLTRMGSDQPAMLADWRMNGTEFRAISQDAPFSFNESISLSVTCEDQAEADKLWYGLIADGGEESNCGWLKDAFGVSWQIVPKRLYELLSDPNPARAGAAQAEMMTQHRIIVADLEAAADKAA